MRTLSARIEETVAGTSAVSAPLRPVIVTPAAMPVARSLSVSSVAMVACPVVVTVASPAAEVPYTERETPLMGGDYH